MKWASYLIVILCLVFFSKTSFADDDHEYCGVISNKAFSVTFEIEAPEVDSDSVNTSISLRGKTLYVSTTDRSSIKPFWSMEDIGAFVKVDDLDILDEFEAKLTYSPITSNQGITGKITYQYRFDDDDSWTIEKKTFDVDLSEYNNQKIIFFALDDDSGATVPYSVEEVSCKQNKPLPPPLPPSAEQCDYFPSVAQSWVGNSNNLFLSVLAASSYSSLNNTADNKVGFNNLIINDYNGSIYTPENQKISSQCDGIECILGGVQAKPYQQTFNVPSDLPLFSDYVPTSGDTVTQGSYFASTYGAPHYAFTVNKDVTVTFKSGEYWFDSLNVIMGGEIVIDGDVIFHIKDELSVGGKVIQTDDSSLMVFSYSDKDCPKPQNFPAGPPDIYWSQNDYQRVDIGSSAIFEGHIYAQGPVQLSNDAKVIGAVTACQLKMNNNSEITGSVLKNCDSSKYIQLIISPSSGTGLACDGIAIDFSLVDQDGIPVEGKGQELVVTSDAISGNKNACWSENGQVTTPDCNHVSDSSFTASFSSGAPAIITRYIHSKFLSAYNIDAQVSEEHLSTPAGPYTFIVQSLSLIPSEGVNGSDNNQVASRPFPFRLKLRGKENGNGNQLNCRIIEESRDIDVHFSHVKSPQTSTEILKISQDHGNTWQDANTDLLISFVDGVAGGDSNEADGSLLAKFDDAGLVDFTASGNHKGNSLTSTERFYFRPFTASVCAKTGTLPSNIEELTGAYLASGTDFNGYLKAVNWIATLDSDNNGYGDGVPDRFEPSLVCAQTATPSYTTHNGYGANLSLTHDLAYPNGGQLGELIADGAPVTGFIKEVTNVTKNLPTIFNWNEVGTLSIDAFQHNYFNRSGFNIPSTTVNIGRFYPAYFEITGTEWLYPAKQGSVTGSYVYMDQNFTDVNFEVVAYSSLGTKTENYGLFDDSLKASFSLVGEHANRLNITDVDLNASHWNSGALWHVNNLDHAVIWSKNEITAIASNRTTQADGPFNMSNNSHSITTNLGLEISGVDPVSFDASSFEPEVTEQELLSQPDVRYGRMVLDSVGASVGQSATVPLRVEYWDGNAFVLSNTDRASQFDGEQHCKQTVWPDPTQSSGAILKGSNTVIQGSDVTNLVADANNSTLREQVRFWLRLASTSPQTSETNVDCESGFVNQPWLQYNWRGQGDEDPSTVVTFGIYRGNDRIIFRGESNIIGTSN
ncbi:DUF6701 domain-containing protein [Aliivibrio wodanis]|uniref:DUF6701 domain-containing protein n=1 Tax=Aliivibrio wodanis TaxID=80852 RepID=UPI00406D4D68